jgi:hypothetical protein
MKTNNITALALTEWAINWKSATMRCYYSKKYLKFPRGIVISGVIHPDPDANVTCKAK